MTDEADMARRNTSEIESSVARAAEIVGEKWTLLILRDAFYGVTRFGDFHADLGIARNILSNRLRWLVAHGVMTRQLYRESPDRYEYVLTPKGHALFPVLASLMHWGDEWTNATGERPQQLIHHECGRSGIHSVASCSHCGSELEARGVRVEPLPDQIADRVSRSLDRWRAEMTDTSI